MDSLKRNSLNIVVMGPFGFPNGTGATARPLWYSKGFTRHGAKVRVLSIIPSEVNPKLVLNREVSGVYEGVEFEYTSGQTLVATTRIGFTYLLLKGCWRAFLAVRRMHRTRPVDAILLYGHYVDSPLFLAFAAFVARSVGAVLLADRSEFPLLYRPEKKRNNWSARLMLWLNQHFAYKLVDGLIVLSTHLADYFRPRLRGKTRLLLVPVFIDTAAFVSARREPRTDSGTVIYCGSLDHKGEVPSLLRAFAQAAGDMPGWEVHVVGPLHNQKIAEELRSLIVELGLEGRVKLLGYVPRKEITSRLAQADIMALSRASGTFSTAGFPGKLVEYLATGRPVVTTAVGDIPLYLEDGVNAYLAPPDDVGAFAQKLRFVITHPAEAAEVGRRGQEVARRVFDYEANCGRILDAVRAMSGKKHR